MSFGKSFQAPILVPSDSEDALAISSAESSTSVLACKHVEDCKGQSSAICASKCKHNAGCLRAQSTDCSFRCKNILDCATKLIGACALRCKHVSDCQCKCASKCCHVPECSPSRAVGRCALKCFHTPDCVGLKRETCSSKCKHTPGCSQATCALKCEHVKDCTKTTAPCTMRCNHIPKCTPGNAIGMCALKCVHTKDCTNKNIADTCVSQCKHAPDCNQSTCALKCEHVKNCIHSSHFCKFHCSHVPECTPSKAIGSCTLKCIHTKDCQQKRDICVSECKHTPDCSQVTCSSKSIHVTDCPHPIITCASPSAGNVPECTQSKPAGICAIRCIHSKDCPEAKKRNTCPTKRQDAKNVVASCPWRCSHVPECTPGKAVGSCTLKCIHNQDCVQHKTCMSNCKHSPDCNEIVCPLKCIHAKNCTQIQKSTCAAKCTHVPECTRSQPIRSCAYKCIHALECPESQFKATCSRTKNVLRQISTDDLLIRDGSGGSSSSEFGDRQRVGKCARALESLSAITLTKSCPKVKVEPKCVSFDIDIKESVGRSSAADSPTSSCASARALYYQSKLLATLQILQNKEETVRVQADSLAVAESRIACLTSRGAELKRELERKGKELQTLRKALEDNKVEKVDVSITAKLQEMENQGNIVSTLQNNLSVIEDLYRECFYEMVKQENLIDMLRKSYLDVRLMDKEKSDQISKLHNVINTQKWTLDKCEDIASEVDNLKMEISNFLNSSSNDSGMWEDSFAGGLNDDLQDIAAQLIKLRDLLTSDCTCGLEEENLRLKQDNDVLEIEIGDLRIRISELEVNLVNMEKSNKRYHEQIDCKERELNCIRGQLSALEHESKELKSNNDKLTCQLTRTQALLEDKCSELCKAQQQFDAYEEKIRIMKEDLDKTEQISKENISLRTEVSGVSRRAERLQRRAQAISDELSYARAQCEHIEACYRQKTAAGAELEARLDEAQARGADLCGEARRVLRYVRAALLRMKDVQRDQEEQIKRKDCEIRCLQQRLEQTQNALPLRICPSEKTCFSDRSSARGPLIKERQRCPNAASPNEMAPTCSKRLQRTEDSFASECECGREEREHAPCTSASEMGSCTSTPVPPKRTLKKKPSACVIKKLQCEAAVQRPARCHAAAGPGPGPRRPAPTIRPLSPGEEMFSRLESMSAALADGYRRWTRDKHGLR